MTRRYVCRMTRPTAGAHMTRRRARRTAARPAAAPRLRRARLTAYYTRTLRHSYTPTLLRHAYTPPTRLRSYRYKRYRPRRAATGTGSRPGLKALTCPVHMPCQCTCHASAHVRPTSARAKTAQGQAKAKARARYCVHGTARRATPRHAAAAHARVPPSVARSVAAREHWFTMVPHEASRWCLAKPRDASRCLTSRAQARWRLLGTATHGAPRATLGPECERRRNGTSGPRRRLPVTSGRVPSWGGLPPTRAVERRASPGGGAGGGGRSSSSIVQ